MIGVWGDSSGASARRSKDASGGINSREGGHDEGSDNGALCGGTGDESVPYERMQSGSRSPMVQRGTTVRKKVRAHG